jgi:nitroreductase
MPNLKTLIHKNRSYRRFNESHKISREEVLEMIDAARLSASGRNAQPLKYFISTEKKLNDQIFPNLSWAGFLPEWPGPEPGEQPTAYIVQLHDKRLGENYYCDDGIAIQSIMLTAVENGLGGCIIASVRKDSLSEVLNLPENLKILHVIALGKPLEKVVIEEMKDGNFHYWRDEDGVHHVPKRSLDELVIN